MLRYMKADLVRIFTRLPRIIIGILFLLAFNYWMKVSPETTTSIDMVSGMSKALRALPAVIGIFEMLYVFGDDFKGKTAQIAIGIGISRKKVVLAKWFEIVLISAIDIIFLSIIYNVKGMICGIQLTGDMRAEICIAIFVAVLTVAAYTAIELPVLFSSQAITLPVLLYLLTSSTLVARIINLLGTMGIMKKIGAYSYTLDNCLNVFRTRLLLGNFSATAIAGIVIYLILGLVVTFIIYDRVELEF